MTAATQDPPRSVAFSGDAPLYRLSVGQFEKMIDAGVFPDGVRVELLDGVLTEQMTINPPHTLAVENLAESLRGLLPLGWFVKEEKSVVLRADWQPLPDLSVARGHRSDYGRSHPRPADLAILIEVSDSSYTLDRGGKWRGYASSRIPEYWIVNLDQRRVEVYSLPGGEGKAGAYQNVAMFSSGQTVPVVIDGQEVGAIAVDEILPGRVQE